MKQALAVYGNGGQPFMEMVLELDRDTQQSPSTTGKRYSK
jgi:hypothetical protein